MNNLKTDNKRVIVVLGMHRSGTSCITKGLEVLGVDLGDNLMSGLKDNNEKGFFEDLEFNSINIDLLSCLGHDWQSLYPISDTEMNSSIVTKLQKKAVIFLNKKTSDKVILGLKDPRATRLLSFWISVFKKSDVRASYIFAARNPVSIIKSLKKRDGIDLKKSTYLWLEHVIPSLNLLQKEETVVVGYENLLINPAKQLKRIATFLALPQPNTELLGLFENEFLDINLQHEKYSELKEIPCEHKLVETTQDLLSSLSSDQFLINNKEVSERLSDLVKRLDKLQPELNFKARLENLTHIKKLTQTVEKRDLKLGELKRLSSQLNRKITSMNKTYTALHDEYDERSKWATSLQSELDSSAKWAESLKKDLFTSTHNLKELTTEFEAKSLWASLLDKDIITLKENYEKLEMEFNKKNKWINELQVESSKKNKWINELQLAANERLKDLNNINTTLSEVSQKLSEQIKENLTNTVLQASQKEEIQELNASNEKQRNNADYLNQQLIQSANVHEIEMSLLKASTSWKVTAPLRALKNLSNKIRHSLLFLNTKDKTSTFEIEIPPTPQVANISSEELNTAFLVWNEKNGNSALKNNPIFSIVIPVYGQLDFTLQCLKSIFLSLEDTSHEIIVVDDASVDSSFHSLEAVPGIRLFKNEQNQGFIKTCNYGASKALGQYILFLNNDTEVKVGWLDSIFTLFNEQQDIGVVGSKLIYPNGQLQEAGGILWQDGSAWNYGSQQNPNSPEFNYVKETDYCSGASLAIPRDLFSRLGGFSEEYLPAYCEDSDLCMQVRKEGLKVFYQPFSHIIHHEGISNGRDLNSGIKAYQQKNQKKMLLKWETTWHKENFNNGEHVFLARDRGRNKKLALIIDQHIASSETCHSFISVLLHKGYMVKFWTEDLQYDSELTQYLQKGGVEVYYGKQYSDFDQWCKTNLEYFSLVCVNPMISQNHINSLVEYKKKTSPLLSICWTTNQYDSDINDYAFSFSDLILLSSTENERSLHERFPNYQIGVLPSKLVDQQKNIHTQGGSEQDRISLSKIHLDSITISEMGDLIKSVEKLS